MARRPRLNLPNIPQHVIQRGNNRQVCFYNNNDYSVYLDKLRLYANKYKVAIHAFVLMTNHTHLLATPSTATGVSQMMQSLGRYYVRYINQTYGRTGTLWEGRFRATVVNSDEYLLTLYRYIEENPLRAGMVANAAEYPWSSFRHNALDKQITLITPHPLYLALGSDESSRKLNYLKLFESKLSESRLKEIRDCTNKSWVLGDERFRQQIAEQTGKPTEPTPRGGDRKSQAYKDSH